MKKVIENNQKMVIKFNKNDQKVPKNYENRKINNEM